jgi:predicted ferric reductase
MSGIIKSHFFRQTMLAFAGMPLLIWAMGNVPERTLLKQALSLITILAVFQMIGQFFWSRANRYAVKNLTMSKLMKYHKIIGYTFAIALLVHPVLLVVPKFFEAGVDPGEAFITILTTFSSQGVVLGIIAWCLLLVLTITSFIRRKLPMGYKTWRVFHGVLAILFTVAAVWHTMDLGRHSSPAMSTLIIVLFVVGVLPVVKTYTLELIKKTGEI